MAPRPKCPVCGSRQWHKEPASGLLICSEGHILQNYRNEVNDAQEGGRHMTKKRALKSTRTRKEGHSKADPQLYHGARAQYLYFQCLQLLLRKQIVALTKAWKLPPEFEIVCRDLWTLHLSLLPSPPPPEPILHQQDVDGLLNESKKDESKSGLDGLKRIEEESSRSSDESSPEKPSNPTASQSRRSSSSSSSSSSSDSFDAPELDALLQGLSGTSSSSDETDDADHPKPADERRRKGGKGALGRHDGPASNIAILVVACWTMRLPVIYMDFVRLIEAYNLPFLDPLRYLPQDMVRHLTKHTMQALSPPHTPMPQLLHSLSSRLARKLQTSYRIQIPELNAAPLMWRVVRAMGGTPVLYDLVKRVGHALSLPLTLHHTLAPKLSKSKENDPESHKYDNVPPEVALLATCVVVLKLVYGLDGRERLPRDPGDPACALPRKDEYLGLIERLCGDAKMSKDAILSARTNMYVGRNRYVAHRSTTELSDATLDEYLDFCEKALVGKPVGEGERTIVEEYFPIKPTAGSAGGGEEVERAPPLRATLADDGAEEGRLEPGRGYVIYNAQDVLGEVAAESVLVMERSAEWAGVSVTTMERVTERYERRLVRWWDGVRRRESREAKAESG
ncbi:hypothetical protein OF83DRAFT_1056361 [Amylostereum chailletii]|nr:hypothetical protein OF83DRAFT_1056361 [Amylostereum chailletii]